MKTKGGNLANMGDLALAHGRGAGDAELMALSGLSLDGLRAIMSCDMFKGLAQQEARRLADGAQ